jgi:hypothetical protein
MKIYGTAMSRNVKMDPNVYMRIGAIPNAIAPRELISASFLISPITPGTVDKKQV